ncbi:Threonine/homoserine efflux transporter RhtA [Kushneria avicenniae]|uniref:Threonine/homoserine efflux transporter RhtA n=1 Tax=Kushneria avicenniae TaxID=402385 RepID=A0A1I1MAG5_9GAMM|nr:DMT family transporter [Kushneria avicenniae]SFC82354.1 Threonine/homoserine efflux transporter RhtA [Kushneria avicenniae]
MTLERLVPLAFVGIWSTGFIAARLVAPWSDPLTFLCYRFLLSALVFAMIARAVGASWPRGRAEWTRALLVGILLQSFYLGGVFWAVDRGLPAGVAALVVGLQPLATTLLAISMLNERPDVRQWLGVLIGLVGTVLVLLPGMNTDFGKVDPMPLAAVLIAMLSITLGTIWQKRAGPGLDLRTNAAIQFIGALVVTLPVAMATESMRFDLVWQAWMGLLWSVFGLSVGAISLLLVMIRRGSVSSVASLFYLVPPVVALLSWLLFDETLTLLQAGGMLLAACGVGLAGRRKSSAR